MGGTVRAAVRRVADVPKPQPVDETPAIQAENERRQAQEQLMTAQRLAAEQGAGAARARRRMGLLGTATVMGNDGQSTLGQTQV